MLLIRRFEERVYRLFLDGEIPGTLHQYQGQEAVAAGVCDVLRRDDWITSTHRPARARAGQRRERASRDGRALRQGDRLLQGQGRLDAPRRPGRRDAAGDRDRRRRQHGRHRPRPRDEAAAERSGRRLLLRRGRHERRAPSTRASTSPRSSTSRSSSSARTTSTAPPPATTRVSRVPDVADRAAAYGVPAQIVDGMDVLAVREAAAEAVADARAPARGPTLLECKTYRFTGHSRSDARGYRTREEEAEWAARDPLARARRDPAARRRSSSSRAEVEAELDDAVEFARDSPFPDPAEALRMSMPETATDGAAADDLRGAPRGASPRRCAATTDVFLIGEDIGVEGGFGGAFGVYLGLVEEFGHERIIDTPISEKAIAGAAVGAAVLGMRPIADMQYSDFLFECMDELVNQAAKLRYMSGGKLSVPMVMRAPVGATLRGAPARPVPGELLRPRPRAQSRRAVGRLPRQGHPEERRPRRQPGARLRAQAPLRQQGARGGRRPRPHRRGADGGVHGARSARPS